MPMQPGSPQAQMPPGEDALIRKIQELERDVREFKASVPGSVAPWAARTGDGAVAEGTKAIFGDPGASRVELDSAGLRKYAADGTTVQVDLTGEVAAFSGLITGSEMVGSEIKTALSGARIELAPDELGGKVAFYTGSVNETDPGGIYGYAVGDTGNLVFQAPSLADQTPGAVSAWSGNGGGVGVEGGMVQINPSTWDDSLTWIGGQTLFTNTTTLEKTAAGDFLMRRIFVVADATRRAALVTTYTSAARNLVIDANNPLFIWQADAAPGARLLSTIDGTTFDVIGGGGSGGTPLFADPNADRLVFWDDSAGAFAALTPSTGLTLTGTDLTVSAATDALMGGVELATSAETVAGIDTVRAVTPAGLAAARAYTTGGWVAPTLTNSWVDYGGTYWPAGYRKMSDGTIMLRGMIKNGTFDVAMFTLPVGYRPPASEVFTVAARNGVGQLVVESGGIVRVNGYFAGGSSLHLSLSGVRFSCID